MRVANGLASVVVRFCTVPLGAKHKEEYWNSL